MYLITRNTKYIAYSLLIFSPKVYYFIGIDNIVTLIISQKIKVIIGNRNV